MTTLDLDFVRGQFPAFSEPSLQDWALFENAGGSYPCRQVVDRLADYYRRLKVQPQGFYPASRSAGEAMDEAHRRLAAWLNVNMDDVHFGPSTSQNTYVLARAFAGLWRPGDEIVVTNQDHEANSGAWRRLDRDGIVVKEWQIDRATGQLSQDELAPLLSDKTRMVAFPHCSNVVGQINPAAEIVRRVHRAGAIAVVDGVAMAPHGFPDLGALEADVYLFSLYKTFGPHQGLMVLRRSLLEQLPNQGHFFNAGVPRKTIVPAGPDHAQVAAAAGIADYFDAVYEHHFPEATASTADRAAAINRLFRDQESTLLAPLVQWLARRDDIRPVGSLSPEDRAPTVAFEPLRKTPAEVLAVLEKHRIMAGGGHFYAVRPLEALGIAADPGVVRLSFLHYTRPDEIDRLIDALDDAVATSAAN